MSFAVLTDLGVVCALGEGALAVRAALRAGAAPGMQQLPWGKDGAKVYLGRVTGTLPSLAGRARADQSRNNGLLLAALEQLRGPVQAAIQRHGRDRVGVVLGTSTSGVSELEADYLGPSPLTSSGLEFHYGQMEIGSPSAFLARELGLTGPAWTLSTACSSSAKALISARRLLRAGLCDVVLAGGADSLARMTHAGFSSLGAVDPERSRPFHEQRAGINLGEAAALFLITLGEQGIALVGAGESSDAHHLSAPEPNGAGAAAAMRGALADARLSAKDIDYLNAHGTGTLQNDAMEMLAVHEVLGDQVPVSSTKPLTGHTLGAAGALEAALGWLLLSGEGDLLPGAMAQGTARTSRPLSRVMSNSFGFGGNNTSLILARLA